MTIAGSVIADAGEHRKLFQSLSKSSHKSYIDINKTIPWDLKADKTKLPKAEEHMWLYGTQYWDQLTWDQKVEMAWMEVARDASMFIHLEHIIPATYAGYVNKYKKEMDESVYEYLMIFSREELTHIMMFHRFLDAAQLPWYAPPGSYADLSAQLPTMRPEIGILFTLLIEWTAENAVVEATKSDNIDQLTKSLFYEHHREEVRHIAFGKKIGEEFFKRAPKAEADVYREHLKKLVTQLHHVYNFNEEIFDHLSFELPFKRNDEAAIEEIRSSEHNMALNKSRFADIYDYCKELEIL